MACARLVTVLCTFAFEYRATAPRMRYGSSTDTEWRISPSEPLKDGVLVP